MMGWGVRVSTWLQKSSPVLTAEATISSKTASPPRAASRNTSVTLAARQSREEPYPNGYTEERKEQTLSAYQERSSLRGLRRTLGVSPTTFIDWLKKPGSPCVERQPGDGFHHRRPEQGSLRAFMARDSRELQGVNLLQRFLEGLPRSDPRGAALGHRQAGRRDMPRREVDQHFEAAAFTLRTQDALIPRFL
jgi:hypothetical protein